LTEQYSIKNKFGYSFTRMDREGEYIVVQVVNHYNGTETDPEDFHDSAIIKVPIEEFKNIIYKLGIQ